MNVSASKGEADCADEPTGRVLWQVRPAGHLDRVVVRTSQFLTHDIQCCDVWQIVEPAGSQPVARPSGVILP